MLCIYIDPSNYSNRNFKFCKFMDKSHFEKNYKKYILQPHNASLYL